MKPFLTGSPLKRMGDRAELRFMDQALAHGFEVLKPWGDNSPFDVAVIGPSGMRKVQVRSAATLIHNRFRVQSAFGARKRPYTAAMIDALAAYVLPHDAWYIIPIGALQRSRNIYMRPHLPMPVRDGATNGSKLIHRPNLSWEYFREAWNWLR